ncbi:MAG: hypothetical protein WCG26_07795, partial [Chloroflexales bacterium]
PVSRSFVCLNRHHIQALYAVGAQIANAPVPASLDPASFSPQPIQPPPALSESDAVTESVPDDLDSSSDVARSDEA